MNDLITTLQAAYPALTFTVLEEVTFPRNEDATYLGRPPQNKPTPGPFVRIENPMGGADVARPDDTETLHRLCAWHQARAEANGF